MAVVRVNTSAGWLDLGSGDGGGEYYEQDDEPEDASVGAIWYDTDAEPVVGGVGLTERSVFDHTTSALVPGSIATDSIIAFPGWRIIRFITNRPARIRLYPTIAKRTADLARGIGIKPPPNSGRLLEVVTYTGELVWDMNPIVDLASVDRLDPIFFVSVTNLDSVTGTVVTTYTYVRTE